MMSLPGKGSIGGSALLLPGQYYWRKWVKECADQQIHWFALASSDIYR
ncbi:MAG: hypothetical protein RI575_01410 [Balneolaceae bacterium]|nr:hypothetical protein [Balneolaceae bacterium]MDR9407947.1 hypothetical protein [Balneolaceae bacterium]